MLHQGFTGPADKPTGAVTVRSGFSNPAAPAGFTNLIGINYTGDNADNSRWVQFTFTQMSAINPATGKKEYQTGTVGATNGLNTYSDGTTFVWDLDADPAAADMAYETSYVDERIAGKYTEIFDQPKRWNGEAETYAASFATRPARVTLIHGFDTYLVVNNNKVLYHVRWNMYFNYNTSIAPTPDVAGSYEVLKAAAATKLLATLKTVLDARFPGNTVP